MQISYTKKWRKLLTDHKKLIKKYGIQAADKITQRLQDLDAAESLDEMPPAARAHPYEPKTEGLFSVDILKHKHPLRLIFWVQGECDFSNPSTIKQILIKDIRKTHS